MVDNSELTKFTAISSQQPAARLILNFVVSSFLSITLLSLFTLCYKYNGVRIYSEDNATDYKWTPHQLCTNMEEGFSCLILDKDGFNNTFDYVKTKPIDILLMGSSHMEAMNCAINQNIGALLNSYFGECKVYNIGISSHNLVYCFKNIGKAYEYYKPGKYIIIETMELKPDFKSFISGNLPHHRAYKIGSKEAYLQQYIPSGKKILQKFSSWKEQSHKNLFPDNKSTKNVEDDYDSLFRTALQKVRSSVPAHIKIIIFYHPSSNIDSNGSLITNTLDELENIRFFTEACKQNNIIFVDTTEDMISLYNSEHILTHGFSNTAVGVGHLNKYGHEVIAKHLAKVITELEKVND